MSYREVFERLYEDYVEASFKKNKPESTSVISRLSTITTIRPMPSKLKELLGQYIVQNKPEVVKPIQGEIEVVDIKNVNVKAYNLFIVRKAAKSGFAVPEALIKRVDKRITKIVFLDGRRKGEKAGFRFTIGKKIYTLQELQKLYPAGRKK